MIKPNSGEDKNTFISRCVVIEKGKGRPQDQAVAMCYSIWKENLRSLVVTEDFKVENVKPWVDKGYDITVQSNRIFPIVSDELQDKLIELQLSSKVVKFSSLESLDKIHNYSAVLSNSKDPVLDTLMLRGKVKTKRQRTIESRPVNNIEEAEEIEKELYRKYDNSIEYKLVKVKVYYSYGLREDVSGPEQLPTTRQFCKEILGSNKQWTLTEIRNLNNGMDLDPFLYAGGFWREKGSDIVHKYCRHRWYSNAVLE